MRTFNGGEFIVMGVPGTSLDKATRAIVKATQPAGFILFARNMKEPAQLRNLTDELRSIVDHEPIICIDQEGGRVSRLKEFMNEPPSARQLAERGKRELINQHGLLTGKLLRLFGFNLNLAPVLDILVDERNDNSLKGRTYGRTADEVVDNARAFADGMRISQVLSCGKHFPGYSAAAVDPHHALPSVSRTREEMTAREWQPFVKMAAEVDLMMVGHVEYPMIDSSRLPASLSPVMVQDILRKEFKFKGCTITDDMDMGAIKEYFGSAEAAALALKAGNDLMLVCHNIEGVPEIARTLSGVNDEIKQEAYERIESLRSRLVAPTPFAMDVFNALNEEVHQLARDTVNDTANQGAVHDKA